MEQADQQPNLIEPIRRPEPIPLLFLVFLVVAPGLCWAADFGFSYLLVSATCNGAITNGALYMHIIMVIMLIGSIGAGVLGFLIWSRTRHVADDPQAARTNFLAATTMLMSVLFTFGVVLASTAPLVVSVCQKSA